MLNIDVAFSGKVNRSSCKNNITYLMNITRQYLGTRVSISLPPSSSKGFPYSNLNPLPPMGGEDRELSIMSSTNDRRHLLAGSKLGRIGIGRPSSFQMPSFFVSANINSGTKQRH